MTFSLFFKKNGSRKSSSTQNRSADDPATVTAPEAGTTTDFANSMLAQRHIARATERKIDAIEYEMSRDILKRKFDRPTADVAQLIQPNANLGLFEDEVKRNSIDLKTIGQFESTLALRGCNTDFLTHADTLSNAALASSENIPALEEAAILFASEEFLAAELILQNLIVKDGHSVTNLSAWLMLFDLYQINNDRDKFEQLGLDYVSKMEISAPTWVEPANQQAPITEQINFIPSLSFSGKLNEEIIKQTNKLPALIRQHAQLRLEFTRITDLTVAGCEILLKGLRLIKKSRQELSIAGGNELIKFCRALIAVGRKDDSDAPWHLLLELLQLINDQASFEEASIDYCITYEISPPSFEPARHIKNTSNTGISEAFVAAERFLLPRVVKANITELIEKITKFSLDHHSVQLDCAQLDRIDFSSCGQLLSGLIPLSKQLNVSIEFHNVNHLVIALLNAMGFKNISAIFPRKC